MKPYSESCARNRDPILKILQQCFLTPGTVLEIGSGTGQHAVHFAQHLPHLHWIASDRAEYHQGIGAWIAEAALPNLRGPIVLDVSDQVWPVEQVDYVYSANTAHIMSWSEVEDMFAGIERVLRPEGLFCLYGPFNRNGQFTSESNRDFDEHLRARDPNMGIRDDAALLALGKDNALTFTSDHSMPANNRVLMWQRMSFG